MLDFARRRRVRKNKAVKNFIPKGILDVIESDYPDRYVIISEDRYRAKKLFSEQEWIDILTKSRNSHGRHAKHLKIQEKL